MASALPAGAGRARKGTDMAKSASKSSAPMPDVDNNPFASLFTRMMRETVTMQAEMVSFVSKRVKADMDASQEIFGSKDPAQAAEAVQRYYQRAFEDYMAQTNEMIEAAAAIARDVQVPHEWMSKVPETGEDEKSLNT